MDSYLGTKKNNFTNTPFPYEFQTRKRNTIN